ncbi:G2 and S phase-expressed protein 1 [Mixophyes fleayi]|uniref:G2 and S phase-expressed protein 1 n=1 Tax=Mixophyes fleayi TaxID=3061075 RepID=UPI003F4DA989
MDAVSGFTLLADEKFDFDISLSPTSAKEDEDCDEVFIGPVGHKEKCVSAAMQYQESKEKTPPHNIEQSVWSPLSGDKFVEIFKEAHLLALQLECFSSGDNKNGEPAQTVPNPVVEKFVQESKTKLNLFETFNEVNKTPLAIKRETYCIQDSPFHQLPPSMQQRLAVPKTDAENQSLESQNCTSPLKVPKVVKSLSVSPLVQKSKAKQVKSNVPLPNTGKTVSKLQPVKAPATHMKNSHLTVGKPKAAKKFSPSGRKNLSSLGSTEDLLSDKSSVASDVSDSSFNNSIVGKRTLPVPNNKVGLKKMQFKTPSAAVAFRKNTTSSSSSQSSMNSSMSFSPPAANAKLNASLNTSLNTSINSSRLKPSTSKLALVRPLGGMAASLKTSAADLSNNHLKPNTLSKTNGNKSTSLSVADSQTPAGKFQRQTSAPNLQRLIPPTKPESAVKGVGAKPQARVVPTPTSRLKVPQRPEGFSPDRMVGKPMKPTRLLSCGEIGSGIAQSTPLGVAKGMLTNSSLTGRGISSTPSSKHVSALPTPLSRRTSGMITPRTIPRSIPSLRPTSAIQATSKSAMKPLVGSTECEQIKAKVTNSPSSPIEDNATSAICCSLNFSPENKTVSLAQSEKQQSVVHTLPPEVLLIDIGVGEADKVRKHSSNDSQPLIDLSNTPEINKRLVPLKPTNVGQLIDLSSPLIKLSPAVNKENMALDYPLLQF